MIKIDKSHNGLRRQAAGRRPLQWSVAAVALIGIVLLIAASPVGAASLVTPFAQLGEGAGQINGPEGLAVDNSTGSTYSGRVYVGDVLNHRIDVFDSTGVFLFAFGEGVRNGAGELQTCTTATGCQAGSQQQNGHPGQIDPRSIGVDPVSHDVYVTNFTHLEVEKYSPNGEFILMFGKEVNKTAVAKHASEAEQNVCTASSHDLCGPGVYGTGPGAFHYRLGGNYPRLPLAIDSAGHVWVGEIGRLEEFSAEGAFLSEVALPGIDEPECWSLAIDGAGDFYILYGHQAVGGLSGVRKYDSSGAPIDFTALGSNVLDAGGEPVGLTLAGTSRILVDDALGGTSSLLEYDATTGAQFVAFGATLFDSKGRDEEADIAWGESAARGYFVGFELFPSIAGELFSVPPPGPWLRNGSLGVGAVTGSSATLHVFLNAENHETDYHFEYVTGAQFEQSVAEHGAGHGFEKATATATETLPASFAEPEVSTHLAGLVSETLYHVRVAASNECEAGKQCQVEEEATFETGPPVRIGAVSVSEVSANGAQAQAEIEPFGIASGYRFEYITEAEYQANVQAGREPFAGASRAPVPDGTLAAESREVVVSEAIEGLTPGTAYRLRVSAGNVGGEDHSVTIAFVTQRLGAFGLPDGRQWEMVSPPEKHGALFVAAPEAGIMEAAANRRAFTYLATAPTETNPVGYSNDEQIMATRTASGWISRDISLPRSTGSGASIGEGQEYRDFTPDLSMAVVQPFGAFNPALSLEASEQTAYLRTNYLGGDPSHLCTEGCLRPLVTGAPGVANVPVGIEFERYGTRPCKEGAKEIIICGPQFVGADESLDQVVISSGVRLTENPEDEGGLYEWSQGALSLVSVLPNEKVVNASTSGPVLGSVVNNVDGRLVDNAISQNGTRVVWSEKDGEHHLYLRDMSREETVQLDEGQGRRAAGVAAPIFQGASMDGERVFFTDTQRLTADAGAEVKGPDLYECRIVEEGGKLKCLLTDLTPTGAAEYVHDVQGLVLGVSDDGSYVYFVANAQGTGDGCADGSEGAGNYAVSCGLYVSHDGQTQRVATVSEEDSSDWSPPYEQSAGVSRTGRWLAFVSRRPLTGYDNRDARTGAHDPEVYLYDAAAGGGAGKLICASCNPTGGRPTGGSSLPTWISYRAFIGSYEPRFLSGEGRLFFDSSDALAPQDTNGTQDVYEFEPAGLGGCRQESQTFSAVSGGCASPISSGTSPRESTFLDASESGGDVFFMTAAQLVPADVDSAQDVYDAHECTASSPCAAVSVESQTVCEGESCQGPPPQLQDLTPGSLSFAGPGNQAPVTGGKTMVKTKTETSAQKLAKALTQCRRRDKGAKRKRQRVACEHSARAKYSARAKRKGQRK